MRNDGQLRRETAVQFQRLLPGPVERVWEFLTQSEHLPGWVGAGRIEPRVGGEVRIADGHITGVVTQWKPPHLLTLTWNVLLPGERTSTYPESYVTFELQASGAEVLLTLIHRPILPGLEAQTLMGWHTLLELLGGTIRGEQQEPRSVIMERNRIRYGVKEIKR